MVRLKMSTDSNVRTAAFVKNKAVSCYQFGRCVVRGVSWENIVFSRLLPQGWMQILPEKCFLVQSGSRRYQKRRYKRFRIQPSYWTNDGVSPPAVIDGIFRMDLNDTSINTVADSSEAVNPYGIALDSETNTLYWTQKNGIVQKT